ncbi:hypothetical protein BJX96DRAFT_146395 [Aspergillus floccosus]
MSTSFFLSFPFASRFQFLVFVEFSRSRIISGLTALCIIILVQVLVPNNMVGKVRL